MLDAIATCWGLLVTYRIAIFVLYACFSTINYIEMFFNRFSCSSDYPTILCFNLSSVPRGSDMRGFTVVGKITSLPTFRIQ